MDNYHHWVHLGKWSSAWSVPVSSTTAWTAWVIVHKCNINRIVYILLFYVHNTWHWQTNVHACRLVCVMLSIQKGNCKLLMYSDRFIDVLFCSNSFQWDLYIMWSDIEITWIHSEPWNKIWDDGRPSYKVNAMHCKLSTPMYGTSL